MYSLPKCLNMSRETLCHLFTNACKNFAQNECVRLILDSNTEVVTYLEMESMVDEIRNRFKDLASNHRYIGIICSELDSRVIAIITACVTAQISFVFVDIHSANILKIIDHLHIRLFICEETNIRDCMAILGVTVTENLSSSNFFRMYRILERDMQCHDQFDPADDIAFAAFSSGSTGCPKIIQIPFRCIIPNVEDLRRIYKLQPSDTIYVTSPPTFDPCILDIFLALSSGCRLLLAAAKVKFDEKTITNIFSSLATICYVTPSVFTSVFPKAMKNTSLRILTFGGEPFPNLDSAVYPCLENIDVYNIYGITEVSCWASINLVVDRRDLSLGVPLSETIFEVRDEDGNVINDGVGELFIGSYNRICIVENYDNSGVTKPCFRASGDIVEVKDNKYFYVGRTDRRIKVFGHRVDLALIDVKLSSHAAVEQCYSIFIREENVVGVFVVPSSNDVTVQNVETFLARQFPSRVLPTKIFLIAEIPLNKHGKVCEKTCEQLYRTLRNQSETDVEREFENLWRKYTTQTSVNNNEEMGFIECGGNSILALQFTTALMTNGRVPSDFIVALLSNVKYSQCLELISRTNNVDIVVRSPQKHKSSVNDIENDEWNSGKMVKLERSFGSLKRVVGRGGNNNEFCSSSLSSEASMKVKWKHDMTKCVDASPTVLIYEKDSFVVCGSHSGEILIVDVSSGNVLTKVVLPDRIESSACASSCGKHIFIGCYDHNIYCISMRDGDIEWTFKTGDMVKSSPVYFNNEIYFGSYDHHFYCISQEGKLRWKTNIDESSIYAAALVDQNIIVVTTLGGTIAFLKHDGCIKFKTCCKKPFFSSPCAVGSDLCVTIDVIGIIRVFNTISGAKIWQYQVDGNVFSSISRFETNKFVFGCHDKRVYCFEIDEKGAKLCWRVEVQAPVYATPFCFQNTFNNLVCVATTSGSIYIIKAIDGTVVKSCTTKGDVFSSPIVVGSTAVFGCRNNYLYALDVS